MNDPMARAFAAYFKACARDGSIPDHPAQGGDTITVDGRDCIVLSNVDSILAVYRIRVSGALKGLRRWPAEINVAFEPHQPYAA